MPGMPIGKPTCPAASPSEINQRQTQRLAFNAEGTIAPALTPGFAASAGFSF